MKLIPPPSSAEVKNAWSYTSTPPIRLHSVVPTETALHLPLTVFRFPAGAGQGSFSLRDRIHTGCGAHPAFWPMGTGSCLPEGKAVGV